MADMRIRVLMAMVAAVLAVQVGQALAGGHPATDAYPGWRLGCQAYTFRMFTFFEAVDKTASLGLDWIEAYPGQTVGGEFGEMKMGPGMSAEAKQAVKEKLRECGVRMINFGVVGLGTDEAENRKVFEFAREMGVDTIASEPPLEAMDCIDNLCREYQIKLAIHNHPQPSRYWNPDTVLEAVEGRSQYIGACADTGHWTRSGIDPVEALRKLSGRIKALHLKDLNEVGKREAHDVVWGTGVVDMEGVLAELNRQGFQGTISIEYEHNWQNSLPEIRQCVAWYEKAVAKFPPKGWKRLFELDLSNATLEPGTWTWDDEGVLTCSRQTGKDLWTKDTYGDFVLDCEFMTAERTNSGIFLRAAERTWLPWVEVQIGNSYGREQMGRADCGAIFDVLAPSENAVRAPGEWNHCTIRAEGPHIVVVLNNVKVVDMDLNRWTEAGRNPDGTRNKFSDVAYRDLPREGYLGFQDHGLPVWFRNIKIKTLD